MKTEFISRSGSSRVILFFLGWGMDATPFAGLNKPGYELLSISDYTGYDNASPDTAFQDLETILNESSYAEIVVMAWSFGVRIASDFLKAYRPQLPITRAIAVNGTEPHISTTQGIPCDVFNGTLANLSEASVRKFRRRMFSSASDFTEFQQHLPQRDFASLKNELESFARISPIRPSMLWDRAIIGEADAIFPAANQCEAWRDTPVDIYNSLPHCPDFQQILDRYVIDKELVAQRFAEADATYRQHATIQTEVARNLWLDVQPWLPDTTGKTLNILEVGSGSGTLTDIYYPKLQGHNIELWDIAPIAHGSNLPGTKFRCCDAETAIRECDANSFDLIISTSALQWFNSPEHFISESAQALRQGGVAALTLYGPGTYHEIATATGDTLKYPTLSRLTAAAQNAGMEVLESREDSITRIFASLPELLRHIKLTGVNALNRNTSGRHTGNATALRLLRHYPLAADGSAPLTYHPLYLIFRKPAG